MKKGEVIATVEVFNPEQWEIQYRDDHVQHDGPREEAFSITNDDASEKESSHHIASIVAIKPRLSMREKEVKGVVFSNCGSDLVNCQPELKGGAVDISMDQGGENSLVHNGEVSDTTVQTWSVSQQGTPSSRNGLKVPLEVRGLTETAVGGIEQPELKGGLMNSDNCKGVQKGLSSDRMRESPFVKSGVSLPDQEARTSDGMEGDHSYASVSAEHVGITQCIGTLLEAEHCGAMAQASKQREEIINSQEMLEKGNRNLQAQLIEEREKVQKTIAKGATQDIIESMLNTKECICTQEEKVQMNKLSQLANNTRTWWEKPLKEHGIYLLLK